MRPVDITLQQLGQHRLKAMCGARDFMSRDSGNTLTFRVPGNLTKNSINYVAVKYLSGDDLYALEFGRIRGGDYKVVAEKSGVYATELRPVFTEVTGLALSLGGH